VQKKGETGIVSSGLLSIVCLKQSVDLAHHLKGVGNIYDVGFAAGPAAVGIEGDGAAVGDEAPANDVRLFAVATGGKAFGVAGRRSGLPDLIQMRKEWENGVPVATLIDEGFAAAERCACCVEEAKDEVAGFCGMGLAVGLFLGPACAGNEEKFGVGADGLLVVPGFAEASDRGAECGEMNGNFFDLG
jgi:hypothetical protein